MPHHPSHSDLEAYLDEALPVEMMTEIETALRADPQLGQRLAAINSRHDAGVHSVGEIWRRGRLSCPTREQLGSYLLGAMPEEVAQFIRFHLETVACRYCQANLEDLQAQAAAKPPEVETRRRRYFQSSAGYLKK